MLSAHFKTLYEHAGLEWTETNNEEIEKIMDAVLNMAKFEATKILLEYNLALIEKNEKKK